MIANFSGKYDFLSPYYVGSKGGFDHKEKIYPSFMNALAVEKNTEDPKVPNLHLVKPFMAEILYKNIEPSEYFLQNEEYIIYRILVDRFNVSRKTHGKRSGNIKMLLKETAGEELIWENDHDDHLGVVNGVGDNLYGKALMKVRDDYIRDQGFPVSLYTKEKEELIKKGVYKPYVNAFKKKLRSIKKNKKKNPKTENTNATIQPLKEENLSKETPKIKISIPAPKKKIIIKKKVDVKTN